MAKELKLMKGNEAIARAMIASGTDGYFGYPITPQSEVMETLMAERPWDPKGENYTGMVVLQAESELASINMVYGGAATGKKVATSSSSPGISLMAEGLTSLGREMGIRRLMCILMLKRLESPHRATISRAPRAADTATISSTLWLPRRFRKCTTSCSTLGTSPSSIVTLC